MTVSGGWIVPRFCCRLLLKFELTMLFSWCCDELLNSSKVSSLCLTMASLFLVSIYDGFAVESFVRGVWVSRSGDV